jgi:indolepyruvate decarboxylase
MTSDDPEDGFPLVSRRTLLQTSAAALVVSGAAAAAPGMVGSAQAQPANVPVADYLLRRLSQHGVKHLFGIPAKTCEALYRATETLDVKPVVTSSDLEAGYAADGYARMRGLAAIAVARGVGTLSLANAIAGAYAERSPVVLINGGPSPGELNQQRNLGILYSHSAGKLPDNANSRDSTDLIVFRELCAHAIRIERAADVPDLVDNALAIAMKRSRPVYIEIAREVWEGRCQLRSSSLRPVPEPTGNEEVLARKILTRLYAASRPALLLGVEIGRYGLGAKAAQLVDVLKARYATTLLAKSVLAEDTPGFAGVHDGANPPPVVRAAIDRSNGLLTLGCVYQTQHGELVRGAQPHLMRVAEGLVKLPGERAVTVDLSTLLDKLLAEQATTYRRPLRPWSVAPAATGRQRPAIAEEGLTYDEVLAGVNGMLDANFVAMTDTSLSSYSAGELKVVGTNAYVANAVWQSIGYSAGAALGVAKGGTRRPLVICGDGGFQQTAQAMSSLAHHKVAAIVLVLDNGTYGIEQYLIEPGYFKNAGRAPLPVLDLQRWDYVAMAKSMGVAAGSAFLVETPAALAAALTAAKGSAGPALLHVKVRRHDLPAEIRLV